MRPAKLECLNTIYLNKPFINKGLPHFTVAQHYYAMPAVFRTFGIALKGCSNDALAGLGLGAKGLAAVAAMKCLRVIILVSFDGTGRMVARS
jgi:hypothetical protein